MIEYSSAARNFAERMLRSVKFPDNDAERIAELQYAFECGRKSVITKAHSIVKEYLLALPEISE